MSKNGEMTSVKIDWKGILDKNDAVCYNGGIRQMKEVAEDFDAVHII